MTYHNKLELNEQFVRALGVMEDTGRSVFVTGRAGTGKSTLLDYFRSQTKKKIIVLAPTGVAAINVKGETIHSFFRFKPDITISKVKKISGKGMRPHAPTHPTTVYQQIDTIIIDEISMVRADLLDCVDKFLRLNGPSKGKTFGGIQLIFIGDLYQLPPVVSGIDRKFFMDNYESEYFFDSHSFKDLGIDFIELEKIYRQKDASFINILNGIRNNTISDEDIKNLNSRYSPEFIPKYDFTLTLTTTNKMAGEINTEKLGSLMTDLVSPEARIKGDIDLKQFPTEKTLRLKAGSQVMMLNNDHFGRWVNGTIGKIIEIGEEDICVEFEDRRKETVTPHTWDIFHFTYDQSKNRVNSDIIGTFTQYPLKLAWAITIHKSQGLTFDNVVIDLGKGTFAHGQLYVALSRCRTLKGITLKTKIKRSNIMLDYRIRNFITKFQYGRSDELCPLPRKMEIIKDAIRNGSALEIIYLKSSDEKNKRVVKPIDIGEMEYKNRKYIGFTAFCSLRGEVRTFRVDRILEIREPNEQSPAP
ncbi:MAG: AAA family ATPase [Candidatus Margulisiibacteriota bacterium]